MKYGHTLFKEFLLLSFALSVIFAGVLLFDLDLQISSLLYSDADFPLLNSLAFTGKYLPILISVVCLSFVFLKKHPFKKSALLAACLMCLGPGIINNLILKPYFQRPRPVEIEQFSKRSDVDFVPLFQRGNSPEFSSFPSGHCGAAFFLIFPWFCLPLRKKYGMKLFIPGFIFGSIIALIRIIQGKHFFSDTVASFAVVYFCGLLLASVIFRDQNS